MNMNRLKIYFGREDLLKFIKCNDTIYMSSSNREKLKSLIKEIEVEQTSVITNIDIKAFLSTYLNQQMRGIVEEEIKAYFDEKFVNDIENELF
jgi:hypothetical protein